MAVRKAKGPGTDVVTRAPLARLMRAVSAVLAVIIPPSILMVVWGGYYWQFSTAHPLDTGGG